MIVIQPKDFNYYLPVISCVTDNSTFHSQIIGHTDWYYPSGRQALDRSVYYDDSFQECSFQSNHSYYVHRRSHGIIYRPTLLHLILLHSFTESMNNCFGIYQCSIPDRHGELQQLFLGIYNEISKYIYIYIYNSASYECTG